MTPGVYTYTITGTAPCANATAAVTVTETTAADAGTDGAITLCSNGVATGLFAQLGGSPDAGGSWTDPNGIAHSGTFTPGMDVAGVYTYLLASQPPCASSSATVTVTVETLPDAGADATVDVCAGDPAFLLFDSLGGTPNSGGTWTDPANLAFSG